ncbi:hypothetical protein PEDI_53530 [Persicobacter diffluens]|uniref:Uncharacterized protein n=1 Tax=Persicobacter diffluens TaxID=981 RepID=A0AAN4W519_9BACT|nr:hypothetical protein PEDI_53530 [Persicobacter diffluens]
MNTQMQFTPSPINSGISHIFDNEFVRYRLFMNWADYCKSEGMNYINAQQIANSIKNEILDKLIILIGLGETESRPIAEKMFKNILTNNI